MAFDFPPSPTVGTLYPTVAVVGQPQYRWNGTEWTAATFDPAGYVKRSGDAMSGALSLAGDPTQALHAVPKQYLDAQRQRFSLAGVNQFDVQVPAGAIAARLNGMIYSAISSQILIQISVAAGVFRSTVGDYGLNGFTNSSNSATVSNVYQNETAAGMYLGDHVHAGLPAIFSGLITLKRPDAASFIVGEFTASTWSATSNDHYFLQNYVHVAALGSVLGVLAFRIVGPTVGSWGADSYLNVEWL